MGGLLLWAAKALRARKNSLLLRHISAGRRAEIALRESQAQTEQQRRLYDAILTNTPDLAYIFDLDHRFVYANEGLLKMWGKSWDEAIGKNCLELGYEPWHAAMHDREIEQVVATKKPIRGEVPFSGTFGRRIYDYIFVPVVGPNGNVEAVAGTTRDITDCIQAREALRNSEDAYRTLTEQVKDYAIFRTDVGGRALTWNQGVKRVLGFDEEEFIGKDIVEIIFTPEDVARGVAPRELEVAAAEGSVSDDRWMRRKDGERFFALGTTTALRKDGELIGFTKVMRDQTELRRVQEKLSESEVRYRRLFEAAQDGILILDAGSGKIIDANDFMTDLTGRNRTDLLGKELFEIGMFEDVEDSRRAVRQLQRTKYLRYEHLPIRCLHSQRVDVEVIANVYYEDQRLVAQCNIRDISERMALQKRIAEQAQQLAGESRRKDEFLAMLSHELRNPLAPILNAAQLLRLHKNENSLQQEARLIIERQVSQLAHLIDDLLDVSRVSTGKIALHKERVEIKAIVENAVETVRPLIEERSHILSLALPLQPVWLDADSARLEQVFVNLLNNAAKFTEAGGRIWFAVQLDGDSAVIRVKDTGIGIAPELLPQIFDLFRQGERSLDRAQGGLGIGLNVARRLVELHRGTVAVNSVVGQGSEFVVRLPITAAAAPKPQLSGAEPPVPKESTVRVLVVDDNVHAAQTMAMLIETLGHEVRTAYDGGDALVVALNSKPHVVLLDIGLPVLNGYEVAKRIRQQSAGQNTVIAAMTGYGQQIDRERSREAGFDHHLVKPADFAQVKQILATVSEGQR